MKQKLTKSRDKKISGVCGGIAEYFGWDITLVRAIYAVLTICSAGFPGIVLYIILMLIMPEKE